MTFHCSQANENNMEIAIINREDPVLRSPSQDKREREMVVKYRISSNQPIKAFLVTLFVKRIPGFIKSRW